MSRNCPCRHTDDDDWCFNQSCVCHEDDPDCPDNPNGGGFGGW